MPTPLAQLPSNALVPATGIADDVLGVRRRLLAGAQTLAGNNAINTLVGAPGGNQPALAMHYFDPADFVIVGRTLKLVVEMVLWSNSVAPTATSIHACYCEVLTSAGTGPSFTFNPPIAWAQIDTPGASGLFHASSGDFQPPGVAGYYGFCSRMTAAFGANSAIRFSCQLLARWV